MIDFLPISFLPVLTKSVPLILVPPFSKGEVSVMTFVRPISFSPLYLLSNSFFFSLHLPLFLPRRPQNFPLRRVSFRPIQRAAPSPLAFLVFHFARSPSLLPSQDPLSCPVCSPFPVLPPPPTPFLSLPILTVENLAACFSPRILLQKSSVPLSCPAQ